MSEVTKNFFRAIALFIFGLWLVGTLMPEVTPAPPVVAETQTLDPRIAAIADRVGISHATLSEVNPEVGRPNETKFCLAEALSCIYQYADYTQKIYIFPDILSKPQEEQNSVLSHEYLHHIWWSKVQDKQQFCSGLMTYYDQNPRVHDRMQVYVNAGSSGLEFCNELHSVLGTEMVDSEMNPKLLEWYIKWLPNRNALPSYF